MTGFAWPFMFLLLFLPFAVRKFLFVSDTGENDALRVPFYSEVAALTNRKGTVKVAGNKKFRLLFLLFIWILLVTAAARPQWAGPAQPVTQKSRNMIMTIDLSESMEITDFEYKGQRLDRFQALKIAANNFLDKRKGDRVGLVAFGTEAYEYVPLTLDLKTAKDMFSELEIGFAGPLTAIGDALGLALKKIKDVPSNDKVIILLSDGEANAGLINVEQALKTAKEMQVKIYTIGIGAYEQKIKGLFGTQIVNPSEGLDEATLQKIADETGGKYYRAYDTKEFLKIYDDIDALEPVISAETFVRPVKELFYYPLGLALILSVLAAFVFGRGGKA
jgi:Ca-activated chloride channel family protein